MENLQKKHHMHSHPTQKHISAKKHNSADVTHSLQFHISSEILVDVLWNKGLDSLDAKFQVQQQKQEHPK